LHQQRDDAERADGQADARRAETQRTVTKNGITPIKLNTAVILVRVAVAIAAASELWRVTCGFGGRSVGKTPIMRVRDSVVVVTGASSGIGRATALAFARKGAAVVVAARRAAALDEVAGECEATGGIALAVPTDVSDAEAVQELARRAVERFGRIDVWVNNAAVTAFAPFQEIPLEDFRRVLDVNIMGYVHGARAALPYLRDQGKGVLVNVSSIVSSVPQPYTHA
jgi:hypothetical protein